MSRGLMVALDLDDPAQAVELARQIGGQVAALKVGPVLFTKTGPAIVRDIRQAGGSVFLDLKFHDIPNTVGKAAAAAAALGVSFFTIHASGGPQMIAAAKREAREAKVLAVTVLTSLGEDDLGRIGVGGKVTDQVVRLAVMAREAGADGIVCSPMEVAVLRGTLDEGCALVTPGIRPVGASGDDQTRISTPAAAVRAGADYLVVGRPIIQAADRQAAVREIVREMEAAGS